MKSYRPYTPSRRHMTVASYEGLTKEKAGEVAGYQLEEKFWKKQSR